MYGSNVCRLRARGGRGTLGLFTCDVTFGPWGRELKVRFVYVTSLPAAKCHAYYS